MARRSEHSAEELRELTIQHAYDLIAEKGEAGFRAREIAKRMGYTVGTIYYLFGNMDHLRYHVAGKILDRFFDIVAEGLTKSKNKINYMVTIYLRMAQDYPQHTAFLYSYKAGPREKIPEWYLSKYDRHFILFSSVFSAELEEKKLALKAAKTIWACIHGICTLLLYEKLPMMKENNPESIVKHLANTYLNGLR